MGGRTVNRARTLVDQLGPPLIPAIVVLGAVEALVRGGAVPAYLVPAPSAVAAALITDTAALYAPLAQTIRAAVLGFAISAVLGTLVAVALASSRVLQRALYPYAVFLQTVPIVSVAPLLVIWFGWDRTSLAAAVIVSVFPVIANTLTGLRSTDPSLVDLFRLYGASPVATLWKLRIPAALPQIFTGLRVAGGLAVIGAVVGEFITGQGIGGAISIAQQQQRVDLIFAGIFLASMLGLGLFAAINLTAWLALSRWHASETRE